MPFPSTRKEHRSYDQESGMNRVKPGRDSKSRSKPDRKPPPPQSQSEDDSFTESEAEEFVQAKYKDDSRRPKTTVTRTKTERGHPQQQRSGNQEADADDIEHVDKPEAKAGSSGFSLLLAMTRQTIPVPIQYHETNYYVPDCANMFVAIEEIGDIIAANTKLYEICPDFTTIGLSLYYAHVYYYQILRAREEIGTNTRFDRRSLRIYESIGRPESWPIAAPLTGFVQALGAAESPDKMYSTVSPAFPDFSLFTSKKALNQLQLVRGIGRTPIVPAIQEFLRRYGTNEAFYDPATATYQPVETPFDRTTRKFLGIEESTATSYDFQSLVNSSGWIKPAETEEPIGFFSTGQRQTRVLRWAIPSVPDTSDFQGSMETYLFGDQTHLKWIKNLLRTAEAVNKFFPGSTNLGAIPAITRMETFTTIVVKTSTTRSLEADQWYTERNKWSITLKAKTFGDESTPFIMAAAATSTNSEYDTTIIPHSLSAPFTPARKGPYFGAPTIPDGKAPLYQCESIDRQDPADNLHELINGMYDNRALE
nr:MAG: capsid protein [Leptosphaeria biglobosa partitivirus 2]